MTLEPTQFATETQLWNAIARALGKPLPLPAGQVVLTEAAAPVGKGADFRVGLGHDLGFGLRLQDFPFARLANVEITLAEVLALPAVLSDGLLLAALDALVVALPPTLGPPATFQPAVLQPELADCWLAFETDLGSGAVARGLVGGRRQDFVQALTRLFPGTTGQAGRMPDDLLQGLSVEVSLAIGALALPLAAARALGPGDVLIPEIRADQRWFRIGGRDLRIGTEGSTDTDAAQASGWTVKEMRMTDDTPDAGALGLEDVPLTLRFVTEDRRIALSDLQDLVTGALLPVEVTPLAPGLAVRIQANGATIGEGHLVQIDDKFAVRVARISTRAS